MTEEGAGKMEEEGRKGGERREEEGGRMIQKGLQRKED